MLKNRDGELAILPHEKADMLNNYFASVFTEEDVQPTFLNQNHRLCNQV